MQQSTLSQQGKSLFKRIEFDPDEVLICEIRKHPFGEMLRYVTGSLVVVIFAIVFFILPSTTGQDVGTDLGVDTSSVGSVAALVGLLLIALAVVVTLISVYLYKSNVVIVTSEKIAQVINSSIFSSKISQLSVGDVQDVTISQNGFFPKMLNYGTVVIETAGEQQNYSFNFTPNPYEVSKSIVYAHEENLKKYGN